MEKAKSNAFYEGYEAGTRLDIPYRNPYFTKDTNYLEFYHGYLAYRRKYSAKKSAESPKIVRYLSKNFE